MKGGKDLNDLKFGTFVGCFWSDGAASMAVKGLISAWWNPQTRELMSTQKPSHEHNDADLNYLR